MSDKSIPRAKAPAFQMYAAEFLVDENVVLMSNQEVGCYIKLMCYCWREGSIPNDVAKLARLCNEDGSAMAQLWLSLSHCFGIAIADPSRLVHPRLERERKKVEEYRKERSESGLKGAKAKWNKDLEKSGSAMAQPLANDGSSSSSSSSISLSVPEREDARKTRSRGSRLPADCPGEEQLGWCRQERPDLDPAMVRERFRDYWTAQPGSRGTKADWSATWRNWVRNERRETRNGQPKQKFSLVADAYSVIDRERARAFAGGVGGETPGADAGDIRSEILVALPGRGDGA